MGDLREQMTRARREAPSPDDAMTRLTELRERRARNGRVLSAAVALAVTGGLIAGGLVVLNHRGSATGPGGFGTKGATGPATSGQGGTGGPASAGPASTTVPASSGPATTGNGAGGSNLTAGAGQFYYWKFAIVYHGGVSTATYWWSPQGHGQLVSSQGGDGYSVPMTGPIEMGKGMIGDDLSYLSTDPAQLLPQLVQRSSDEGASPRPDVTPGPGQTAETGRLVSAVEDLLSEMAPHSSPDLRIALYGVLKGIATVQDLGNLQDPTGRPGVALRVTIDGSQRTFWFDPDTHLFLAEEEATDPAAPPGYVIVQSGGIVDSDTAVPTGDHRILPEAGPLPTP